MLMSIMICSVCMISVYEDSTAQELMFALDANAAAVSGFFSGRITWISEGMRSRERTEFSWSGDKTKMTQTIHPLPSGPTNTPPKSRQVVVSGVYEFLVERLTLKNGIPVDPLKEICDKSSYVIFGTIANREAATISDKRKNILLLHSISQMPRSKLYLAKDLLSVASHYTLRKTKDTTKSVNQDRIELTLEFPPKGKIDYATMTLRFDPFHGYHCDHREFTLRDKSGAFGKIYITEFMELDGGRFFPTKAALGAIEGAQHAGTVNVEIVELNKGISEKEFSSPFPENCYVYDQRNGTFLLMGKNGVPQKSMAKAEFNRLQAVSESKNAKPRTPVVPKRVARSIDWGWWLSTASIVAGVSVMIAVIVFRNRMS